MLTCTPAHCYSPFIAFLLSTFSPSFWAVFSLVSHCFDFFQSLESPCFIPLPLFYSPPIRSSPCISQHLPTFVITLLSHHVDITVPTLIPSLYLILFALFHTHSFLFPPFLSPFCWPPLSHPFIFPLCSRLAPAGSSKEARMRCRLACKQNNWLWCAECRGKYHRLSPMELISQPPGFTHTHT